MKNKKRSLFIILFITSTFFYANTFTPGIRFSPTFSGGIGGNEIDSHKIGIGFEGGIFCDMKIKNNFIFSLGLDYTQKYFSYNTKSSSYGYGNCKIGFPAIQIPIILKYSFNNVFNSRGYLNIYVGENISFIVENQQYKDDGGTFCGNFLYPTINIGLLTGAEFSYPIGPIFLGIDTRIMFDLLDNEINYRGNTVHTGRLLHFIPAISIKLPLPI